MFRHRERSTRPDLSSLEKGYARDGRRKILFIAACAVLVMLVAGYALTVNGRNLSMAESYGYIIRHILGAEYAPGTIRWYDDHMLWNMYAPRVALGIFLSIQKLGHADARSRGSCPDCCTATGGLAILCRSCRKPQRPSVLSQKYAPYLVE